MFYLCLSLCFLLTLFWWKLCVPSSVCLRVQRSLHSLPHHSMWTTAGWIKHIHISTVLEFVPCRMWLQAITWRTANRITWEAVRANGYIFYMGSNIKNCQLSTSAEPSIKQNKITVDSSHPLHPEFQLLRSGRRYRLPKVKTGVNTLPMITGRHLSYFTNVEGCIIHRKFVFFCICHPQPGISPYWGQLWRN